MRPFRDANTSAMFRSLIDSITSEINYLDNEYFLKASSTELEHYYVHKASINPLILQVENKGL